MVIELETLGGEGKRGKGQWDVDKGRGYDASVKRRIIEISERWITYMCRRLSHAK